jgi:hypothetical protein
VTKRLPNCKSPGSKLGAFFDANPHEELTYADAMTKLGLNPKQMRALRQAVYRGSKAGELESFFVIRRPQGARTVTCPICETAIKVLA